VTLQRPLDFLVMFFPFWAGVPVGLWILRRCSLEASMSPPFENYADDLQDDVDSDAVRP